MKFNHLNVPSHWQNYWSRYPEGHTILEALISWVSQVDAMTDNVNDWNMYLDSFVQQFDTELQTTVSDVLTDWNNNGFLQTLINEALRWDLDEFKAETQSALSSKAEKSEIGAPNQAQIDSWLDRNPSATTTVEDGSVTPLKTNFLNYHDIFTLNGAVNGVLSTIGSVNPSESAKVSALIRINPSHSYLLPYFSFGYAFYNTNGVSVNSERYGYMENKPTITPGDIPAGSEYIRVCWYTDSVANPDYYVSDLGVKILDLDNVSLSLERSIPKKALQFEVEVKDDNISFKWNNSAQLLSIYMKTMETNSYMEYSFQRMTGGESPTDPTTWYNVWRMRSVYINEKSADGSFNRSHPNTIVHTGSEWECAIKEVGQEDFIGGSTHGDEYVENIVFMLDGVAYTNPTAFAGLTCKELRIFRKGSLYRCNTMKGTKVADHYVDYLFKDNTLNINQTVNWTVDTTTGISYLAMLGAKRLDDAGVQITSKALKEGDPTIYDVSVEGFTNGAFAGSNGCKKGYLWNAGERGKRVSMEVEILESNDFPLNNFKFDNRMEYNKFYFDHCGNNFPVSAGDTWFNKAKYKIDYLGV